MELTQAEADALFARCDNAGRWGSDDEAGTLNLIGDAQRLAAAGLIRHGASIALGRPLKPGPTTVAPHPITVHLLRSGEDAAVDVLGIVPHDPEITHIDTLGHVYWNGRAYNNRTREQVLGRHGVLIGSLGAAARGIFTRGVLLDIPAARGVDYLAADQYVEAADLEAAEELAGVTVGAGDAVVLYTGRERREAVEADTHPLVRAGLSAAAVPWLRERDVAVYTGDGSERFPPDTTSVLPFPLHQLGTVAMGLCLVDAPLVLPLVEACARYGTRTFAFVVTLPDIAGATGFPVNPLAVF